MNSAVKPSLRGVRIALPETRELDLLAQMVEERGARTLRCPLVAIQDAPDQAPVIAWLERLCAGSFDDVLFYTGEGVRRLLATAERTGSAATTLAALAQVRKITRGPKPERALRALGLQGDLAVDPPTTAGIIVTLSQQPLAGRRFGVQVYGTTPPPALLTFLATTGASFDWVAPYVYADEVQTSRVVELLDAIERREIQVIAFTSSAQVDRLFEVASKHRGEQVLRLGLSHTLVAAVGPIVRETLLARGVRVDLMPERTFFMKPMVREIERAVAVLPGSGSEA